MKTKFLLDAFDILSERTIDEFPLLEPFSFNSSNPIETQKAAKKIAHHLGLVNYTFVISYASQDKGVAGSIYKHEAYEYDEKGNKVERIGYNSDGSVLSKYTYEYKYDEEGNWTSQIEFKDGVATDRKEREFEYYD